MNDNYEIVFIADRVQDHDNSDWTTRTLEYTEDRYFFDVLENLKQIASNVVHYEHPQDFIDNIANHDNPVVLSIWSGKNSRNRRTLVPSICEAYGFSYVGADTYANILCQDKELSHNLVEKFYIKSPKHVILDKQDDLILMSNLSFPLVVKPSLEGGSIGITQRNLVFNIDDATSKALELSKEYCQSIIAEEFITGEEISFVLFGSSEKIFFCEAVQLLFTDTSISISNKLYSSEIKKNHKIVEYTEVIKHPVLEQLKSKMINLFNYLGKVELIRVDGRFDGKEFVFIELSPDVYLGKDSSIFAAFKHNGYTYKEMLNALLQNAIAD